MCDNRIEVSTLDEAERALGKEGLERVLARAVGYDALDPATLPAQIAAGSVFLDPYLDGEEQASIEKAARKALSDWGLSARGSAEQLLDSLVDEVNEPYESYGYSRMRSVEVAQRLIAELDGARQGQAGEARIDAAYDPGDLADELVERYGMWVEACDRASLASVKIEVSVLVGDVPPAPYSDLASSRHTFDTAFGFLEACATAGQGLAEPAEFACDPGDMGRSNLEWLCETQGTTLPGVLAREGGEFLDKGRFASSLREEISEAAACRAGWPNVAFLGTMSISDYLSLIAAHSGAGQGPTFEVGSGGNGNVALVFDPVNGCGGAASIELERPLEVSADEVNLVMPDYEERRFAGFWTVQECYGLVHDAFEHGLVREAPAERKVREPRR